MTLGKTPAFFWAFALYFYNEYGTVLYWRYAAMM